MSDGTASRPNKGSHLDNDDAGQTHTSVNHGAVLSRFSNSGSGAQITKANLQNNDSVFANSLRSWKVQDKVNRMAAAAAMKPIETELPSKTMQQLMEEMSGVGPMQRFLKGTEDLAGGQVDEAFWRARVQIDPLAAELDAMCQPHMVTAAT